MADSTSYAFQGHSFLCAREEEPVSKQKGRNKKAKPPALQTMTKINLSIRFIMWPEYLPKQSVHSMAACWYYWIEEYPLIKGFA